VTGGQRREHHLGLGVMALYSKSFMLDELRRLVGTAGAKASG
jgi:hypothetical protein